MKMHSVPIVVVVCLLLIGCGAPPRWQLQQQALSQYQMGQLDEAADTLDRLLDTYPGDPEGLLLMGRVHHTRGQYPQALYYYQSRLSSDPGNERCRRWLTAAENESGLKSESFGFGL